ncbi:MAG: hypothetical protein WBE76_04505 [Terracidiphilus sp.]
MKPLKDRAGKSIGDYECSACHITFRPDPNSQESMRQEFTAHLTLSHPSEKKQREDVNRAIAEPTGRRAVDD